MRIARFRLENYGPFEAQDLTFSTATGKVNLVIAPNGAGKSVLRQALRDFVFGIPGQSPMSFRFGYKGMRLLADVVDDEGEISRLARRKGRGNTLATEAGEDLPEARLGRLTGQADEGLFLRLFCLDTELLRSGGRELIEGGGDVTEAIFSAGGGTHRISALQKDFERARDEIAPLRRSGSRPFYAALDSHEAALADLKQDLVRPDDWRRHQDAVAANAALRAEIARAQGRQSAEEQRLKLIRRVRPALAQHRSAVEALRPLADLPALPADLATAWQRACDSRSAAETAHETRAAELEALEARAATLMPDAALLAEAGRIEALHRTIGKTDGYALDLPRVAAEERAKAETIAALERDLGLPAGQDLPTLPTIAAARELIRRGAETRAAAVAAADEAGRARDAIRLAEAALAALAAGDDGTALAAARDLALRDGDPARRREEAEARVDAARAQLVRALAGVEGWTGDEAALLALAPPPSGLVTATETALRAADQEAADARGEDERLRGDIQRLGREIAAQLAAGPLAEPAVVAAARRRRDEAWHLIRRAKFGPAADAALLDAAGGEAAAAATLDHGLSEADALADRRDGESERLASLAQLRQAEATQRDAAIRASARLDSALAAQARARAEWQALCAGLHLPAGASASAVTELLAGRLRVADAAGQLATARAALEREEARQTALARDLARGLGLAPAPLPALLVEAERRLAEGERRVAERRKLQAQFEAAGRHAAEAEQKATAAEATRAAWQEEWQQALSALGRPPAESPTATEQALRLMDDLRAERRQKLDLSHRVQGMRRNIEDFEAEARNLAARLAPDLAGARPEGQEAALRQRLAEARRVATAADTLAPEVEAARGAKAKALAARNAAAAAVESLRARIGGGDDDAIAHRLAQAAARAAAEQTLTEAARRLDDVGDHWPLDVLAAAVDGLDEAAVEIALIEIGEEAARLSTARDEAVRADAELARKGEAMAAADKALDAEERRQQAGARLLRLADDALLAHGAAALLGEALERLRAAEDEDSLLARIGARFAQLTAGAYQGVTAQEDEAGRPRLLAVEAGGLTLKRVDELSEGGRDQLYLALRLVMVEDYAARAPALPFVADDLLQTSDEARSLQILEALAALSRHTQVIVLSHHEHLCRLAETLGETVNVVRL